MNINRHNYEEFFILYMDNELGAEERREVESFVEKNPDLKEELELLQQFKMVPDESVVFNGKQELMSGAITSTITNTGIEISNCEGWLVLYMDNELSVEERKKAEYFIATEPLVKKEWNLLQRTRLQPETILFADKASLYRTEEKVSRIPARIWRVAAAVLLFLLAGSIAVIVYNNRRTTSVKGGEIVKTQDPIQQKTDPETPVETPKKLNTPVNDPSVAANTQRENNPSSKKETNNNIAVVKEKKVTVKDNTPVNVPAQVKKEEPVVADNKPSNNLPQPENNIRPVNRMSSNDAVANNKKDFQPPNALTDPKVTTTSADPSHLVNASFGDEEPSPTDGKKNKLRGILRKVTRTFEKRTNIDATDGEDRLLVAGLAIKLK